MQKITTKAAAAAWLKLIELAARKDETFMMYRDGEHIGGSVHNIPLPDKGEPVAALISARRLAWLESRSAKLRQTTGE